MRRLQTKARRLLLTGFMLCGVATIICSAVAYQSKGQIQAPRQFAGTGFTVDDPLGNIMIVKTGEDDGDAPPGKTPVVDNEPLVPKDEFEHKSQVVIWAINPGYKINEQAETGELIELRNLSSDPVDLTGFALRYTNGSGNTLTLLEFPDGSVMQGETVLLRYNKSPNKNEGDLVYTTSLAMAAGPLELWQDDQLVDTVCWTGKTGCAKAFKSSSPTTLVRNITDGEFSHAEDYTPKFDPESPGLSLPIVPGSTDDAAEQPTPRCHKLEFSEIYSYYVDGKTEQFIELYNPTDQVVDTAGCQLRYKKKSYALGETIAPDSYYAYYPNGKFSLTKNPNTSNTVELVDADARVVDELTYIHGQKKATSYAKFYDSSGAETWSPTYVRTPNQANVYQEFRSCESGKVINPETGNCVKADSVADANGACPAGKYRNPLTGRCKTITKTVAKECTPGYERNPETKRCRKVKTANTGADYTLVPATHSDNKVFIAAGIVIVIVLLGISYVVWQFRREIIRSFRKARQRIDDVRKHFFARGRSRDRDK